MLSKIKKNEKGFTLMEMLIVVAIIAVLVAIAIPTFTSSLNKAKVATDQANIRAGYASVMLKVLESDLDGATAPIQANTSYILQKDGSVKLSSDTNQTKYLTVGKTTGAEVAGQAIANGWEAGATVTYTYTGDGKVTIAVATN